MGSKLIAVAVTAYAFGGAFCCTMLSPGVKASALEWIIVFLTWPYWVIVLKQYPG